MAIVDSNVARRAAKRESVVSRSRIRLLASMVKMMKNENVVRPRRSGNWVKSPPDGSQAINVGSIFRIGENDFFNPMLSPYPPNASFTESSRSQPKDPGPKSRKKIMHQIESYCDRTTLHGLRYVGDSSLSLGERIFWLIAFTTAVGLAAYYISNIYEKWNSNPVIISFSPFDADISSVPFPAITICNMNQAKQVEAERILQSGDAIEKKLLNDICNGNSSFDSQNVSWISLRDFLIKTGNSCTDTVKNCKWKNDNVRCSDIFNNDLTDEGLCCSFNRLPPANIFRKWKEIELLNQTYPARIYDWSPEKGFPADYNDEEDIIPRRPLGAGSHLGLTLILDAQVDNYYCSSTRSIGFKIALSNPIETPKMADFGFILSPGIEARYSIDPTIREASQKIRRLSISERQCYFANERPLRYFRSYSKNNCYLECQSNHTYSLCNCVPYYLPKNRYIPYCGKSDKECVSQAKEDMELLYGNGSSCHCLPGCFELGFKEARSYGTLFEGAFPSTELEPEVTPEYFLYVSTECRIRK